MQFTKALLFKGYYPDLPPDMCPEGALIAGSKNFRIINGVLQARPGKELLQTASLEGIPLFTHMHEDIVGTKTFIVGTSTDVYRWDGETDLKFEFLTPRYVTGTASCPGSDKTVTGDSTLWDSGTPKNVKSGDFIKFGTNDIDAEGTPDTWYEIDSVTSDTELELVLEGPATGGLVNYVIRKVYVGTTAYPWKAVDFYDGTADENLLILTNGIDVVQKWDPDNAYMETLGGSPPKAREVGQLGGRLVFGNITAVTGTGTVLPYTYIWSPVSDAESWDGGATDDAGYQELYRTSGEIKFFASWGAFLVVAKEDCIVAIRPTGSAEAPFDHDYIVMSGGSLTNAYHVMATGVIYLSKDDVLVFDGTTTPKSVAYGRVSKALFDDFNHTKRYVTRIVYSPRYNEVRINVPSRDSDYPDKTFIYRVKEDEWCYDDVGYIGLGVLNYGTIVTINELTSSIDSYHAPIDEWAGTAVFSEVVGIDESGYVYIERPALKQDNGVDIAFVAVTADNPITSLDQYERIQQTMVHYRGTGAAADTLTAQLSVDGGTVYQSGQSFNNNESAIRRRALQFWNATGRVARLMFTGRAAYLLAYRFGHEPEGER